MLLRRAWDLKHQPIPGENAVNRGGKEGATTLLLKRRPVTGEMGGGLTVSGRERCRGSKIQIKAGKVKGGPI